MGLYLCSVLSDSVLNQTWKKPALPKALYAHIYTYLIADGQHTSQSKCQTYQGVCNSKEEWKANYYTNGEKCITLGSGAVNGWRTTAPLIQHCDLFCLQSWLFMKQPHTLQAATHPSMNWSHIGTIRYNALHIFYAAVYFRNPFMVRAMCILLFQRHNF